MEIVYGNLEWMGENLGLAMLGLIFGWLFFYARKPVTSTVLFILWVLFVPNTIYLITDLEHLYRQWGGVEWGARIFLVLEYWLLASLGVVTFIASMYPVDKVFTKLRLDKRNNLKFIILLLVNLFIAFALILGKFQRTHSWYIFTDFNRVISDVLGVFTTPVLLILVLFFGVIINLTYFGFKNMIHITFRRNLPKRR